MTENRDPLAELVAGFLPIDVDSEASPFEASDDGVDVLAASLASFAVAAQRVFSRTDEPRRHEFCQRVAAISEGQIQVWMVEASLRGIEGDSDALSGTDPLTMNGIHVLGLMVLSSGYLTLEEFEELRPSATEYAEALRPKLAEIPY